MLIAMVGVSGQALVWRRVIVIVLIAVGALVCLGGLAGPAMAIADGQDCSGPSCDQQVIASRCLPMPAPSGRIADLLAIPAAVVADLAPPRANTSAVDLPHVGLVWWLLAPLASRSPPAA